MNPLRLAPPRRLAMLALGILAGCTVASAEAFWRLEGADAGLLAYGLFWYGLLGALYFGLAGEIARLALTRGWYSAKHSTRPALAGGLLALGMPVVVIYWFVHLFAEQLPSTRLILLFMVLAVSGLSGWCLARALAARPGIWPARLVRWAWRPRLVAFCMLGTTGFCAWQILARPQAGGGVLAAEKAAAPAGGPDLIWIRVRGLHPAAGTGTDEAPGPMPALDRFAGGGSAFVRACAGAWPSIPWPWPFSELEPWLRRAATSDPDAPCISGRELARRLSRAGFRNRAFGEAALGKAAAYFEPEEHAALELRRSLLLSEWLGRSLGAMGLGSRPRLAPAPGDWHSARPRDLAAQGILERLRAHAWPAPGKRDFLLISLEMPAGGPGMLDTELGRLLAQWESEGHLKSALVVLSAWAAPGPPGDEAQPKRVGLILRGPGVCEGKRVQGPVSIGLLPSALLALLGLAEPGAAPEQPNQILRLAAGE